VVGQKTYAEDGDTQTETAEPPNQYQDGAIGAQPR
jgi:hypothetical protein